MDYKKILEGVVDIINTTEKSDIGFSNICSYIGKNCPELKKYAEMNLDTKEIYDLQSKLFPILEEFASRHLPDKKELTLNYPFCQIIIKM